MRPHAWRQRGAAECRAGPQPGNALGRKTDHAEMAAFENAGSRSKQPPALPLDAHDIILVSTLEPCVMSLGAAKKGTEQAKFVQQLLALTH